MITATEATLTSNDNLIHCIFSRNVRAVEALIKAGCAADHFSGCANTPLHYAARYGLTEMVEVLLAYQANPNRPDNWGRTPLHAAAAGGHAPVIEQLVAADADVNACDRILGMTPLHLAARHGQAEALWYLLWYGADRERCDAFGETALTLAYRVRAREVITCLRTPLPVRPVSRRKKPRHAMR